jgi:hypothetical protein
VRRVSALGEMATCERNCRNSPAYLRNIPVFGRLCAETFFDLHCAIDVIVFSGLRPVASYEMRHLRRCSLINAGSERRSTCKSSQRGVSHLKIVITVSGADADTADNLSFDDNR